MKNFTINSCLKVCNLKLKMCSNLDLTTLNKLHTSDKSEKTVNLLYGYYIN